MLYKDVKIEASFLKSLNLKLLWKRQNNLPEVRYT